MLGVWPKLLDSILNAKIVVHRVPSGGITLRKSMLQGLGQALLVFCAAMLAALWSQAFGDDPGYPRMDRDLALMSGAVLGLTLGAAIIIVTLRTFARALPKGFSVASGARAFRFAWDDLMSVNLEGRPHRLKVLRRDGSTREIHAWWLERDGASDPAAVLFEGECARFIESSRPG